MKKTNDLKPSEIDWTKFHRSKTGSVIPNSRKGRPSPFKGIKHPPTKKDLIYAREYIANGGNSAQAALKSDGSKHMANYRKKKMTFSMLLDKSGVGDSVLAKVLKEGLRAKKKFSSPTEPDTYEKDYAVRHKYLETALKVKGHMSNIDVQNNIQVNILDYKENDK